MKRIILAVLLVTGITAACSAQTSTTTTTTTSHTYRYYPDVNVYYEPSSSNYWYWDQSTNAWVSGTTLPDNVSVTKHKYKTFNYTGTDPWRDEDIIKKYKTKNGKTKTKTK